MVDVSTTECIFSNCSDTVGHMKRFDIFTIVECFGRYMCHAVKDRKSAIRSHTANEATRLGVLDVITVHYRLGAFGTGDLHFAQRILNRAITNRGGIQRSLARGALLLLQLGKTRGAEQVAVCTLPDGGKWYAEAYRTEPVLGAPESK